MRGNSTAASRGSAVGQSRGSFGSGDATTHLRPKRKRDDDGGGGDNATKRRRFYPSPDDDGSGKSSRGSSSSERGSSRGRGGRGGARGGGSSRGGSSRGGSSRGARGGARGGGRGGGRGGHTATAAAGKPVKGARRKDNDLLIALKKDWEVLRRTTGLTDEEREALVDKILAQAGDRIPGLIVKHDGSRVVQTCIQYGTEAHRKTIHEAFRGRILELAQDKFAHHLIYKLFKYGAKHQLDRQMLPELMGSFVKLAKNKHSVDIVNLIYSEIASPTQRKELMQEFYGPEYRFLTGKDAKKLSDILKETPEAQPGIMRNLKALLGKLSDKGMVGHSMIHKAMVDFFTYADVRDKVDLAQSLVPHILQVISTKDGALAGCHAVAHLTSKGRKEVLKAMKGTVFENCKGPGSLFITALLAMTDDTTLLTKAIWGELRPHLATLAVSAKGRMPLLQVLAPFSHRYFAAPHLAAFVGASIPNEKNELVATSKKDPAVRSAELLKNTSADLLALVNSGEQVAKLAIDAHATAVVLEALLSVPGDKSAAFEALAQAALAPLADEQEKAGEHIVFNEIGAKFLQCLVLLNKPSGEGGESERCFAQVLLDKAGAKQLQAWALTSEPNERAVFLVRSLVIAASTKQAAKTALTPVLKKLKAAAKGSDAAKQLLAKLAE